MSTWQDLKNNSRLQEIYKERLKITRLIREYFWSQNFVEAETPIVLKTPSQEPYLNFFTTQVIHPNNQQYPAFLRTSPEFALKKLLAAGYSKIFEIGKCFRNLEDFGGIHNPEFTMLEWYRAPGTLEEIMADTENLFKNIAEQLKQEFVEYKNNKINIAGEWDKKSMKQIWQEYLQVNLDDYLDVKNLQKLAAELDLSLNTNQTSAPTASVQNEVAYEDLFFKIFLNKIEPNLGLTKPIFIYDYPARMCSLSRLSKNDPQYAERFELYIGGLEVANAFGELTDAEQQLNLLEEDKIMRVKLKKPAWPVDPDLIAALESGIPANSFIQAGLPAGAPQSGCAAGIALGLDRMVLLFTSAKDINEVIFNSAHDQFV